VQGGRLVQGGVVQGGRLVQGGVVQGGRLVLGGVLQGGRMVQEGRARALCRDRRCLRYRRESVGTYQSHRHHRRH
jgi:hypothetical protein